MSDAPVIPDFEKYADRSLHVEADVEFPQACVRALAGSGGRFLDLGAGDGAILRAALQQGLLERFSSIEAIDVSATRVERITEMGLPRVHAAVGTSEALPFLDGSIDFVFSHQVIEHVPSDRRMVDEIVRVLAPGGHAFVTSVSKRWYGWYFYRCNGKWTLDPTHVREYPSLEAYTALFASAGLEVRSAIERPLGHRLDKILFRIVERFGGFGNANPREFLTSHPALRALRRIELRVPGYAFVEVLAARRDRIDR